ncbi:MAG: Leucine-rich repeat (LRR) protein [Crocinitomicaceae bacterium]|jgi:Leucine-rich repeat (LRR) protein
MLKNKPIYRILGMIMFMYLLNSCVALNDLKFTQEGTSINLSKDGLTKIPDEVFDHKEVKVLRLFGNQIDSISERIGELENLEELFLGRNLLTSLPASIGKLKKLRILSVQNNNLISLPDEIGDLESLEELYLNQNDLIALPETIGNLKELVVMKVNYNWLESIPESIGECTNLGFIHLTRNNLTSLPSSLSKLSRLKELYLVGAGPLLDVPESMCDLNYFELIVVDNSIALPACMYVLQANRLQVIQR